MTDSPVHDPAPPGYPAAGVDVPLALPGPRGDYPCGPATAAVLHVINGDHYAGAERVQDLLAARLPGLGFDVGFCCLKPGRFAEARRSREAPLFRVPMQSRIDLRAAWHVAGIVRREGFRLIHAHTVRSGLVGRLASALTGTPLVYHVHSPAARDTTHRFRNRASALAERITAGGASRLVAVSESLAGHLQAQGFPPSKIRVVHNGVPCCEPTPCRRRPTGQWTLGTVALFRPRKGLEVLLDALAILKRKGVPVRLRAVGPFETAGYEARVKELADTLGVSEQIQWSGFTSDVGAELARMDLFVLPSLFGEGLPMVVLEAMAAGVPVVATRVEGVPEAVRDGQEGVLAAPGDAMDLVRAIERVVEGRIDWAALSRSALVRQSGSFSDASMAAGVAAVYRELL